MEKLQTGHLHSAFSWELISKSLRMACGNQGSHSFYLPTTRLSTNGMSHPVFTPEPAQYDLNCVERAIKHQPTNLNPQPHSITALWPVVISCPTKSRRLSWPGWLATYMRWYAHPKMVTHPSTHWPIVQQSGIELKTIESQVWCPNHNTTHIYYCTSHCCLWFSFHLISFLWFIPSLASSTNENIWDNRSMIYMPDALTVVSQTISNQWRCWFKQSSCLLVIVYAKFH